MSEGDLCACVGSRCFSAEWWTCPSCGCCLAAWCPAPWWAHWTGLASSFPTCSWTLCASTESHEIGGHHTRTISDSSTQSKSKHKKLPTQWTKPKLFYQNVSQEGLPEVFYWIFYLFFLNEACIFNDLRSMFGLTVLLYPFHLLPSNHQRCCCHL